MNKFKVGQLVVCINANFNHHVNKNRLVFGKKYFVIDVLDDVNHIVIDESGFGYNKHRFITVSEYRVMKIKSLYE